MRRFIYWADVVREYVIIKWLVITGQVKRTDMTDAVVQVFEYTKMGEGDDTLLIQLTDEGVIVDAYAVDHDGNDMLINSWAMTAPEIFDALDGRIDNAGHGVFILGDGVVIP